MCQMSWPFKTENAFVMIQRSNQFELWCRAATRVSRWTSRGERGPRLDKEQLLSSCSAVQDLCLAATPKTSSSTNPFPVCQCTRRWTLANGQMSCDLDVKCGQAKWQAPQLGGMFWLFMENPLEENLQNDWFVFCVCLASAFKVRRTTTLKVHKNADKN